MFYDDNTRNASSFRDENKMHHLPDAVVRILPRSVRHSRAYSNLILCSYYNNLDNQIPITSIFPEFQELKNLVGLLNIDCHETCS